MIRRRPNKLLISLGAGLLVAATGIVIDLAMLPFERGVLIHQVMGDFVAGLMATLVCLAIQLKNEEVHYEVAMERAAIVADLNHHVRNAVFPLFIAVQRNGDAEAHRIAGEAMERINMALKDATADAFVRRVDYGPVTPAEKTAA